MSEALQVETKYGTVGFSRKVNDGDYGATEASIFVPFVVVEDSMSHTMQYAEEAYNEGAAQVLTALGIPFEVDQESGLVREVKAAVVAPAQTQAQAVGNVERAFPGAQTTTARPQGGDGGKSPYKVFKRIDDPATGEKMKNPSWFAEQVEAARAKGDPISNEFWDQRGSLPGFGGTRSPKGPWFKDKEHGTGIWPPRGHPDNDRGARALLDEVGAHRDEEPF